MKDFWKSKTVWIAVIQFAIGGVIMLQTQYPEVGGLVMAKSALDVILRFITSQPIK